MISIANGLRISATNLDALKSGEVVGSFSKTFLAPDKSFALYPDLQVDDSDLVTVDFWAECKSCENIDNTFGMTKLSQLTALPVEELESIFQKRASIFLLVLRVYKLSIPIQVQHQSTGNFIPLPEIVTISEKLPILDDEQFQQIQEQSKDLELLIVPDQYSDSFTTDDDFLGINYNPLNDSSSKSDLVDSNKSKKYQIPDLSWIQTISTLGDRSIEGDKSESSYQAGTKFENIVKQSLEFLGFTVDITHKGGAGGLDLFCSKPYPVAGECKAGRSKSDKAVEQIDRIAKRILKENYLLASGLIILGSGDEPTKQLIASANSSKVTGSIKINIIKAITLQKLVELKAKYDGAINLFELKNYLQGGQIDKEIDKYIQKVENEIKLRSHIVNLVKKTNRKVEIGYLSGAFDASNYPESLDDENKELTEILIELSSPLAGYLGRVKGNGENGDRFYYLRDLPCNT
ncbi:MAG: DUF1802 family protein [Pseudanabaena sp. ELA645]|jgi:hypothetical protein